MGTDLAHFVVFELHQDHQVLLRPRNCQVCIITLLSSHPSVISLRSNLPESLWRGALIPRLSRSRTVPRSVGFVAGLAGFGSVLRVCFACARSARRFGGSKPLRAVKCWSVRGGESRSLGCSCWAIFERIVLLLVGVYFNIRGHCHLTPPQLRNDREDLGRNETTFL